MSIRQQVGDLIEEAITQHRLARIKIINVFDHTGWAAIDGEPAYLHAGGALRAGGNVTSAFAKLDPPWQHINLPDPTRTAAKAAERTPRAGTDPIRVVDWVGRVLAIGGALGVVIAIVEAATRQLPLWGAALAIAGCGGSIVVGIGLSALAAAEFNAMTAPQKVPFVIF